MPPVDAAPARPTPRPPDAKPAGPPGPARPEQVGAAAPAEVRAEVAAQAAADSATLGKAAVAAMGQPPNYDQGVSRLAQGVTDAQTVRQPAAETPAPASPPTGETQAGTAPQPTSATEQPAGQAPGAPAAGETPTIASTEEPAEDAKAAAEASNLQVPERQEITLEKKVRGTWEYAMALKQAQAEAKGTDKTPQQIQQDALHKYYGIKVEGLDSYTRQQIMADPNYTTIMKGLIDEVDWEKITDPKEKKREKELLQEEALKYYLFGKDSKKKNWLALILEVIAVGGTMFTVDQFVKLCSERE